MSGNCFGLSSDAKENQWEIKGKQMAEQYLKKVKITSKKEFSKKAKTIK